jgi:hypothetical protein
MSVILLARCRIQQPNVSPQRVNGGVPLPISLLVLKSGAIRVHQTPGSQLLTHFPAFAGTFGFSVCAP